jgi:hypothetical protein
MVIRFPEWILAQREHNKISDSKDVCDTGSLSWFGQEFGTIDNDFLLFTDRFCMLSFYYKCYLKWMTEILS